MKLRLCFSKAVIINPESMAMADIFKTWIVEIPDTLEDYTLRGSETIDTIPNEWKQEDKP